MKRDRSEEVGVNPMETAAKCLMLLSKVGQNDDVEGHRVFACKTCNKRFPTFQALGGHRTSHRQMKLHAAAGDHGGSPPNKKAKTHECSTCGVEFAVGQALGGHMRRHRAAVSGAGPARTTKELLPMSDIGGLCLDLNLAPPSVDCFI